MTQRVLVKHMGHDGPWLLIKTRREVAERRAYIRGAKPDAEVPRRLALLKIVTAALPPRLEKAYAAREKAYAAREKADAAWKKAYAAWKKADAAWKKADAAWKKAINSPEGVKFHAKVCGCSWTPEQPDVLQGPEGLAVPKRRRAK
jgi:hypothetical protein